MFDSYSEFPWLIHIDASICALLAYLLCQSQHNIKVVPADERNSVKNNVHSGTVLSGEQLQILSGTGLNASSFLLTAHGGLKGTSKPVLYRTLLNENEYHRPSNQAATPLTREKLERLVYHMSFQYTTATKAVRLPPVIGYSKKSADIMMMYINYQRESSRLVTYNPPVPEGEDEVEADGAGRENFLCLSEVSRPSNTIPFASILCTYLHLNLSLSLSTSLSFRVDGRRARKCRWKHPGRVPWSASAQVRSARSKWRKDESVPPSCQRISKGRKIRKETWSEGGSSCLYISCRLIAIVYHF